MESRPHEVGFETSPRRKERGHHLISAEPVDWLSGTECKLNTNQPPPLKIVQARTKWNRHAEQHDAVTQHAACLAPKTGESTQCRYTVMYSGVILDGANPSHIPKKAKKNDALRNRVLARARNRWRIWGPGRPSDPVVAGRSGGQALRRV